MNRLPHFWILVHDDGLPGSMRSESDPFSTEQVESLERYGVRVVEYVPVDRWIPVTERLPPPRISVIASCSGGWVGSAHVSDIGQWVDSVWMVIDNVTHWRPMPRCANCGSAKGEKP